MDAFWQIKFRGKEIRIALNDLSNQRLREMKAKFGPEYGIPAEFIGLLLRGDLDAYECAVWIGQQKLGGEVDALGTMDFNLEDDFEKLEDPKPKPKKGAKENPTQAGTTTDGSTETPSPSDASTSSPSETSSD